MKMGGLMWPMLTLMLLLLLPSLHIVGSSSLPYAYDKSVQVSEEIVTDSISILDCQYEGKKDDGDGDGDGDSSSSDIIVVCQFRFVRPAASRLDEEEDGEDHDGDDDDGHVHIRTVIPLEPTRVTDERGLPTNYLVSGVMHYQQQLQQQQQSEHNNNKAASTTATITATTTSPEQFQEKEEWSDPDSSSSSSSSSSLSSPKERVLEIGLATYRPPYSQHGSRVQAVLNRAPKKDLVLLFDKSSVMDDIDHEDHHDNDDYDSWLVLMKEWVDWYLELGSAHFPTANQPNHIREDENVWVEQVELAINAYRQAIHVLEQQVNTDQRRLHLLVRVLDQDIVLATAYYYLGEAYYLDPDLRYIHQSVEAYQKSQRIYQSILLLSLNEQQQQQQQEEDGDGEGRNTQEEWTHQQQQRQRKRKQQVEARLAECSTKLGMALLYSMDPMATAMISAMVMGNNNNNNNRATPSHALSILRQAQEHFQTAIGIYESSLLLLAAAAEEEEVEEEDADEKRKRSPHREEEEEEDRQEWELGYATALQQAASAFTMEGKLQEARRYYEQALAIQSDSILPKAAAAAAATNSIQAQQNSQTAIADLYLSLSDTCVQLGDYPCAKESYQNAMDFHAQYNIPVAPVTTSMVMEPGDDEFMGEDGGDGGGTYRSDVEMAISETLEALKEYRLGTSGAGGSGGQNRRPYSNDGLDGPDHGDAAYYYEKDDGYEGDLLASLGTMYLSLGDETNLVRAIGYLELAVEKYSNSPEDRKSVAMADLLVNLALAYYRNYQFEDSIFTQWKALDIFQSLYGDGVNPYTQDENYNEMLNMMQEQHHQSTMGGAGGYPGGGKQFTSQKQQQQQQPPIKPKGEKPKDETKKVDLESYRRSIQNVTEGATPKTVKEEL